MKTATICKFKNYTTYLQCSEFIIFSPFPTAVSEFVSSCEICWAIITEYYCCIVIITHGRNQGLTIPSDISATLYPGGGSPYYSPSATGQYS